MGNTSTRHAHGIFLGGSQRCVADYSAITDKIFIGNMYCLRSAVLKKIGANNVLNCARELQFLDFVDWAELAKSNVAVHHLAMADDPSQPMYPTPETFVALAFIDKAVESGQRVLVNCAQGISRSVSLVIAWLMTRQRMTYDAALLKVKTARPIAQPNCGFEQQLRNAERNGSCAFFGNNNAMTAAAATTAFYPDPRQSYFPGSAPPLLPQPLLSQPPLPSYLYDGMLSYPQQQFQTPPQMYPSPMFSSMAQDAAYPSPRYYPQPSSTAWQRV